MRRTLCLILCVCIIAASSVYVSANYDASAISPRGGGRNTLNVPLEKQINTYYCGPASVKMVLSYLGVSATQSTLGTRMQTNQSDGSFVWRVTECLNHYLGANSYEHVLTTTTPFPTGLMASIDDNKPVICHVMTRELPNYPDGRNSGHYVVATGYFWAQGGTGSSGTDAVYYNDPHYDNAYYGSYSCRWSEMTAAINANHSYYIMGT